MDDNLCVLMLRKSLDSWVLRFSFVFFFCFRLQGREVGKAVKVLQQQYE